MNGRINGNFICDEDSKSCALVNFANENDAKNKFLMHPRGALIVFEGCDRTGKSTQAKNLLNKLQETGRKCKLIRFPDRTLLSGKLISEYLKCNNDLGNETVHLLFSANRWELKKDMLKWLHEGYTLIVDRYAYSGVVYTSCKPDNVRSMEWLKNCDAGLIRPDLVFLLTLNAENQKIRAGFGDERYENATLQAQVSKRFLEMKEDYWKVIDASRSISVIHDEIAKSVLETIKSIEINGTEIKELW